MDKLTSCYTERWHQLSCPGTTQSLARKDAWVREREKES